MPAVTDDEIRAVYGSTIDALYGYVSRRCGGNRELAEDVTQETWLRAVRTWHRTGLPKEPIAWLRTVAHNLICNEFRRDVPLPLESVSPEELLEAIDDGRAHDSSDLATIVNHALARLPKDHARLIEAFHYERHKVAQIATTFGISERAVEGRLRRAREHLKQELATALAAHGGVQ